MTYRLETIHHDLALLMGQGPMLDSSMLPEEQEALLPLRLIIRRHLPGVAEKELLLADISDVDVTRTVESGERSSCGFRTAVPLPADFLRLVGADLPGIGFRRENDGEDTLLSALGGDVPPILARVHTPHHPLLRVEGRQIAFYCCKPPGPGDVAITYISRPRFSGDDSIRLPEKLYPLILRKMTELPCLT